jgi:glutamate dehydrogenase/leucine dehydrogenase
MSDLDREFDHEQLEFFHDRETGLTGAVAIHSTALGPAMGGLRLLAYPTVSAAATDALRLARAMSLKNSAAGLDLGGGKAVLIDDGNWGDRGARMRAFGRVVERLGGRYITAEDVGTAPPDMDEIAEVTRWVAGRSLEGGGSGNPAPSTARTVFGAIESGAALQLGSADLTGVRVGVQGVGHVGSSLVGLLRAAGADVVVADVDAARVEAVAAAHQARIAPVDGFVGADVDVLAPCGLGEVIRPEDVPELRCRVIAGAANNPLADTASAAELAAAGILYVPDFLANCGGIIQVAGEILGFDEGDVQRRIAAAIVRTADVLAEARSSGRLPNEIALERAQARIREAGGQDASVAAV